MKYSANKGPDLTNAEWKSLITSDICSIQFHADQASVEQAKSGMLMFAADRSELVNGYQCKVYDVNDLKVTHRSRLEHLSEQNKQQLQSAPVNAFLSLIGIRTSHVSSNASSSSSDSRKSKYNPHNLSLSDYFNVSKETSSSKEQKLQTPKDVGIGREMIVRSKKSQGQLWMTPEFPLSITEHVLPILHLMHAFNPNAKCFAQFATSKLPKGFPVKLGKIIPINDSYK